MKESKFKIGTTVEIIGNASGHGFEMGEICEITDVNTEDRGSQEYTVTGGSDYWFLDDPDIKLVNSHTNKDKKYWKGSYLNVGTDKKQDWIDCGKIERFKFDQKDLNNRYYICLWFSGQPIVISDLSEEQHNDIRFEILDYLDKL